MLKSKKKRYGSCTGFYHNIWASGGKCSKRERPTASSEFPTINKKTMNPAVATREPDGLQIHFRDTDNFRQ